MPLVEISNLSKRYGSESNSILAVDNISFKVEPGEVVGFLGPNGAGKSTTMKVVAGFLSPTEGKVKVCGFDVTQQGIEARRRLGYLPEGAPAYPDMTAWSFLDFCAGTRGLRGDAKKSAIDKAIARTNLQGVLRQPVETLSKGFKRRVGLAQAILHEPEVLVMDEPTDGLDPNQKHEVRNLIREMARSGSGSGSSSGDGQAGSGKGKAIILSTHILEEVDAVCTRAIVIAKGKIVADCTPAQLLERSKHHNAVTVSVVAPAGARVREELSGLAHVRGVEITPQEARGDGAATTWTVFPKQGELIAPRVMQCCQSKGWKVESLRVEAGRMDEVFREMTR